MHQLSIAGADDQTNLNDLASIIEGKSVEIGLLYFPEKQGEPRNPTKEWRRQFFEKIPRKQRAVHLCGKKVFEDILSPEFKTLDLYQELQQYRRIQININARQPDFNPAQVSRVFEILTQEKFSLIFQYHENSAALIEDYVRKNASKRHQFSVLLDNSRGKGIFSGSWQIPKFVYELKIPVGIAGGLNAENLNKVKQDISYSKVWFDLESGARTNNVFDLNKVIALIACL